MPVTPTSCAKPSTAVSASSGLRAPSYADGLPVCCQQSGDAWS
jgi:hypothetical protein